MLGSQVPSAYPAIQDTYRVKLLLKIRLLSMARYLLYNNLVNKSLRAKWNLEPVR